MELNIFNNKEKNNSKELENEIKNSVNLENEVTEESQNNFLETTLGKAVNFGLDLGLRAVLPDVIETPVIEVKDAIMKNGFDEGVNSAIQSAIDVGKSALGIITGKFDSVSQAHTAVKKGGILDAISTTLDGVLKSATNTDSLSKTVANLIKKGKDVILDSMSNKVEETFMKQVDSAEKLGKYINNWNTYYDQRDLDGMKKEYGKIKEQLKELMPLEETIKQARKIESIQTLIQSKKGDFDITPEEMELLNKLG